MPEILSNGVVIPQGIDKIHKSGVQSQRNMGASIDVRLGLLAARLDVLEYSTGLLDVSHLVGAEWTNAPVVKLARVGGFVAMWLVNFSKGEDLAGTHLLLTLPLGFRAPETTWGKTYRGTDIRTLWTGATQVLTPSRSVDSAYFFYPTTDPIPDSLPTP